MPDGGWYVFSCYALAVLTLGVWFTMIVPKLRRGQGSEHEQGLGDG